MNLNELGVQELNAQETQKTDGGFWWFRFHSVGIHITQDLGQGRYICLILIISNYR